MTVSGFVGQGKKTAWSTWNAFPELTDALLELAHVPTEVTEQTMKVIERFTVLLYERTSTCTDVDKATKKMFAKTSSVQQRIPPTRAALEQHIKWAAFQGGHIWGQALIPLPDLPSPCSWGWLRTDDGLYEPLWTTLEEASKSCDELLCCGCKKGCQTRCKCIKARLQCTALCKCEGECQTN